MRRAIAFVAILALAWTAAALLTGGFAFSIGSTRVSSRSPFRPAGVGVLLGILYVAMAGAAGLRRDGVVLRSPAAAAATAAALALGSVCLAFLQNAWTAGGSDAFAYVTQADLLLQGILHVPVPLAADVPWPDGLATFTPYGYRPMADAGAIVPVTAPGLPLLMAGFMAAAGHCAAFWVPPLTGGLLVWVTFIVGRRLDSPWTGVAAAWLLATSPTYIAMAKSTMSDVPASAFWALSIAGLLRGTPSAAIGAGLSASMATLIRPNLAPVAAVAALWCVWGDRRAPRPRRRAGLFVLAAIPGALGVAAFNAAAYGSPIESGYGDLGPLFAAAHVPVNAWRFTAWLVDTQTPLALAGLVALAVPTSRLWRTPAARRALPLLAGVVVVTWLSYVAYTPFDAWWFLRFLLPGWLPMCLGVAVVTVRAGDWLPRWLGTVAVVVLAALGVRGLVLAQSLGVFPPGEGERRYASIALLVREATPPSAVIITGQHAGPIRYYAGRLTVRFDRLDEAWLDRAVAWLAAQGRPAYLLIEDWERPQFERRFAADNAFGRLMGVPVLAYRSDRVVGTVYLFDPRRPDGPTRQPLPAPDPRPRCVSPVGLPQAR